MTDVHDERPKAPIEYRNATLSGVNFAQRIISLIAVPYGEPSQVPVMYRGAMWDEIFERGAFDGIEKRPGRVRVNRDHDRQRTVGKAVAFWPSREEGLVAELRISQTALGDETLALADDEVLVPSIGFGVRGSDQALNPPVRRIKRAFVEHIGLLSEIQAYDGARVLQVRSGESPVDVTVNAATLPPLVTPVLDEWTQYLSARRAGSAS